MSDERLDLWLDAAGFDDLGDLGEPTDADPARADDPWAAFDASPPALTDAQRVFVDATSPGLAAALESGTLLATRPFDGLADDEVERADDDVIDFDDDT